MYAYNIIPVKMNLNQTETETKKAEIDKNILSDSILKLDKGDIQTKYFFKTSDKNILCLI